MSKRFLIKNSIIMKYISPETKSLQVNAQTMICASGDAPKAPTREADLQPSVKVYGAWI